MFTIGNNFTKGERNDREEAIGNSRGYRNLGKAPKRVVFIILA